MAIQSCGGEGGGPNHDGNPLISNCVPNGKKRAVRGGGSKCEGPDHDGNPLISNKNGEGGESCGGEGGSPNHDGNPLISNCFSNVKKNGVRIEISTSKELPGEVVVF